MVSDNYHYQYITIYTRDQAYQISKKIAVKCKSSFFYLLFASVINKRTLVSRDRSINTFMIRKQSLTSILLNILSSTSLRIVYTAIIFGLGNVSCFVTAKQCSVSINNNKVTQDYTKDRIL